MTNIKEGDKYFAFGKEYTCTGIYKSNYVTNTVGGMHSIKDILTEQEYKDEKDIEAQENEDMG